MALHVSFPFIICIGKIKFITTLLSHLFVLVRDSLNQVAYHKLWSTFTRLNFAYDATGITHLQYALTIKQHSWINIYP